MAVIASTKGCSSITTVTPSCWADDWRTVAAKRNSGKPAGTEHFILALARPDLASAALAPSRSVLFSASSVSGLPGNHEGTGPGGGGGEKKKRERETEEEGRRE